ncbi:Protein SCD6 [Spathaspora sp. JA1]|nr:Protein SCD6 [Spathaspora sp. JA1]
MSQYIGKTISLISNKGLRYVGLLDNINSEDATVGLNSVRLLGTEGRMAANGTPNLEVPPGNDIYEYVVFRGSDVKDLSVLDIPVDQVKPVNYVATTPTDASATSGYYSAPPMPQTSGPAAGASGVAKVPATTTSSATSGSPPAAAGAAASPHQPVETGAPHQPEPTKTIPEKPTSTTDAHSPADAQPRSTPEEPKHFPPRHRKQSHGPDIPSEEFDFESANAKFSKELEQERELEHTGYNKKSSFFDNISSSTEERSSLRWADEKSMNIDTFGEASLQRGGRGGRGRGRGGRGRGGSWRGGYRGRGGNRGRGGSWRGGSDYHTDPEWA